jgi:hypothetical protein
MLVGNYCSCHRYTKLRFELEEDMGSSCIFIQIRNYYYYHYYYYYYLTCL